MNSPPPVKSNPLLIYQSTLTSLTFMNYKYMNKSNLNSNGVYICIYLILHATFIHSLTHSTSCPRTLVTHVAQGSHSQTTNLPTGRWLLSPELKPPQSLWCKLLPASDAFSSTVMDQAEVYSITLGKASTSFITVIYYYRHPLFTLIGIDRWPLNDLMC